jgi:hypothetical protein
MPTAITPHNTIPKIQGAEAYTQTNITTLSKVQAISQGDWASKDCSCKERNRAASGQAGS